MPAGRGRLAPARRRSGTPAKNWPRHSPSPAVRPASCWPGPAALPGYRRSPPRWRPAAAGVLDEAGVMTTTQIRHALRRRVAAIDPEALRKRREAARKEARVELWDEAGGTSALAGRDLDTAAAIAADARLSALARWLKGQGAEGTISYLRSQVYLALVEGRSAESLLAASYSGSTAASAAGASSRPQAGAPIGSGTPGWPGLSGTISLTMPLSAWAGLTDHPGEVSGA